MPPLVEPAVPGDAVALHRLREQIEAWLDTEGMEQWGHGHLSLEEISRQVDDGQWYVVREPVTALRAFYRRQGFREIGRRDFDGPQFSATLLEKGL